jgi:hypothetical protein
MDQVALCGTDTIIINNIVQSGLGDADAGLLEFPNDVANIKKGKEGNMIAALNQLGTLGELTLRYLRGTADDKTMNSIVANFISNPSGFVMMTGEFIKKVGDGTGKVISDNYIASSGVPMRLPNVKSNAEGDPDQGIAVYKIKFGKVARIIT